MNGQTWFFLWIVLGALAPAPYASAQTGSLALEETPVVVPHRGEDASIFDHRRQSREQVRDPFWPVGYRPLIDVPLLAPAGPVPVTEEEHGGPVDFSGLTREEQAIVKAQMVVGGILQQHGGVCIAIINQQLVKEGEGLALTSANKTYHFRVKKLTPERIVLESVPETRG